MSAAPGGGLVIGSADEVKERFLPSVDQLEAAMGSGKRALDAGRCEEALAHFDHALRLKPEYDAAWLGRGHAHRRLGEDEAALEDFAHALRIHRGSEDGWMGLAAVLCALGRHREEVEAYDELLKLQPRLVQAWINKGAALHELGDYRGAVACSDRVLALRPEYAPAWNNKGAALLRLGDEAGADRCFAEALHFNPDYYDAIANRVLLLEKRGRPGEVVPLAERALRIHEAAWLWHLKGIAHLRLLESTAALQSFERALALDSAFREARSGVRRAKLLRRKVDVYRGVYECFGTHLPGDPGCAECEVLQRCREVTP